ncbi:hypothetical protein [Terribacillus saccharophilus]|uniref:Pre-toxin TG domain-containing protein n=1 Tax=Terribacillus saccharophilus TaxID=361277 RepID=A0ABX4H3K9_9BACI|nr:hypothetical protein [Terribacillus saccharophilus]PAD34197.1 hypothetical protein CHH56_16105 [Terribacillus saccharophilus]PAD98081.1 hypothetical protein CHH50_00465 [Terribacillus saccharophilus]PAE01723.1 hypothetical protein CHH48_00465 [Terribacillus saccharophilus]
MDVKYRSSQWEKTRDSLRNLIGLGAWGKGMIDTMKDITDNLDEASEKVAKYDSDGVVSFSYTSDKDKYQRLFEDFKVLEDYSGSVGDIVEDKIDQPFYEDIDEFVQKVRDSSISNYTTKNHIGATETIPISYYGSYQEYTTEKTEITMDDILSGDNYYAEQIKASFEEWKVQNPDEDISYEDYRTAAVNTRAFEYESIEDGQFTKEFWVNIAALVVIVGVTVVCPPAGAVLGAAYATVEMGSAISGKDWASGRELDTTERWTRGILAPIDILPVGKAVTTFTGTARTTSKVIDVGQSASKINKTNSAVKQVDNVIELKIPAERLHAKTPSTGSAAGQADNVVSLTEHANKQTANRLRNSQWAVKEQDKVQELQMVAGAEQLTAGNTEPILMGKGTSNPGLNNSSSGEVISSTSDFISYQGKINSKVNNDISNIPVSYKRYLEENIGDYSLTYNDFQQLKLKPVAELTDEELKTIKAIRDAIPHPTSDTYLQKTIPISDVDKYLDGSYKEIGGYVAKLDDVDHIKDYEDVVESFRLDYTTWDGSRPYPEGGNAYGKIKFKSDDVDDIGIPYGERLGGTNNDGPPCTLNGFTGSRNNEVIPEWVFNQRRLPKVGAELYVVEDGVERLVGIFNGKSFVSTK